jgi:integrase/recombinase XerC
MILSKTSTLAGYLEALPDFVFMYIDQYYRGDSVNTQLGYTIDIRVFLNFLRLHRFRTIERLEDFTCDDINAVTVDDLIKFKAYLREYEIETVGENGSVTRRTVTNSPFGINRKLSAVRGLFTYLYKTDRISQNITDKIDFAVLNQKIKKPLTTQETVSLIDVLYNGENYFEGRALTEYLNRKQRDITLFITYLGTGVRVSELIALNLDDVSFDTMSFIVTRKGGDQQEIFMPPQVIEEMAAYVQIRKGLTAKDKRALFISRSGTRLTVSAVEKLLKNYCAAVGITHPDKTRPHALRRTFACNLLEDGIDIKMVAELMGHKNIQVTHKYYAQYNSKARKEVMQNHSLIPKEE